MNNRIVTNPNIHFGKPCVSGSRITVQNVLELVREGVNVDEIRQSYYPELAPEDIKACVQYAIDMIALEDIRVADAA